MTFFLQNRREHFSLVSKAMFGLSGMIRQTHFSYMDYVKKRQCFPLWRYVFDERYHYTISLSPMSNICPFLSICLKIIQKKSNQIVHYQAPIANPGISELRLRNVVTASASERVIQSLSLLCMDLCKEGDSLPFPIGMKELAKLGATTRETVNQVLKSSWMKVGLNTNIKINFLKKERVFYEISSWKLIGSD